MSKTMEILLSIARVESGGNTGGGKYFYSFDPDLILVSEPDTEVLLKLSNETEKGFAIEDLITTDSRDQLEDPKIRSDGRALTIKNINQRKELILASVLVKDLTNDRLINCDPQMVNRPRI